MFKGVKVFNKFELKHVLHVFLNEDMNCDDQGLYNDFMMAILPGDVQHIHGTYGVTQV